jgi:Tol biopolymer transport system component
MLAKMGTKLLDFGLARDLDSIRPTELTASPTMATPLTAEGSIVGTFQYMAPEQLEGDVADVRSDIFSFGATLYEMLTGKRAFHGKTQASLIAAILKEEPRPIGEAGADVPAAFERIVRQCIAKEPDERWQSAGDLRRELEWIRDGGGVEAAVSTAPPVRSGGRSRMVWPAMALLAVGMLALGWLLRSPSAPAAAQLRASLVLPAGSIVDSTDTALALSPDGTRLAYTAAGPGGQQQIFVRALDSLSAQPLNGTEGATYPFWSPDGRNLGFFAARKLKRIPSSGGTVQSICDATDGRGASWGSQGIIVFAPEVFSAMMQVPASGGTPTPATTLEGPGRTHRNPHFLPDGYRLLFFSGGSPGTEGNGIHSLDLRTGETALIAPEESEGIYAEPGWLLFAREGNLMAQPFNADTLATTGAAVPIAEKVAFNPYRWTGAYAVAGTALLLYGNDAVDAGSRLAWFNLQGREVGQVGEDKYAVLDGSPISISPDGKRATVSIRDQDRHLDLWIFDLSRSVGTRFTLGPNPAAWPIWSPDGLSITYGDGIDTLFLKTADGAAETREILKVPGKPFVPSSWSPDGRSILIQTSTPTAGVDISVIDLGSEPALRPLVSTPGNDLAGRFSPDGKWISWISNDSGRPELFVARYPDLRAKWQVSSGGAEDGFWGIDGREIFYIAPDRRLKVVELKRSGESLEIGATRPTFGDQPLPSTSVTLAPDGTRLLAVVPVNTNAAPILTLVTNWAAGLTSR